MLMKRKKDSKKTSTETGRFKCDIQNGNELRKLARHKKLQKRRVLPDTASSDDHRREVSDPLLRQNIASLVRDIWSNDGQKQLEATRKFRKILSLEENPPIEDVVRQGIVPRFVEFCRRSDCPELQFESLWAITNIASGTSEHARLVVDHGAVPVIAEQLASENLELGIREQAIWALGNIAGDSPKYRDLVLRHNVVPPLLKLMHLNDASLSLIQNGVWTMSNLCRGKPPPPFDLVKKILPELARLVHHTDEEVLTDACWALSYLSDGPNERIEWVLRSGVCRKVVEMLADWKHTGIIVPALRTVGNIVTGADSQTQIVLNCGALPHLHNLLKHNPKKNVKKEACWTISNITAGTEEQIRAVLNEGLVDTLLLLLKAGDFEIRKEAAWAISNITSGGTSKQVQYLAHLGCLSPLCDLLDGPDARTVLVALEGIENILKASSDGSVNKTEIFLRDIEECGGLDKLEHLQDHPNDDIYFKAMSVLKTFFELEDETDTPCPSCLKTESKNASPLCKC